MKKILFVAVAMLFLLGACTSKTDLAVDSKTILERIEADESFVFYVGTTTCPACINYKPVVAEMNKNYKTDIYNIMLDKDTDDDAKTELISLVALEATPTTVVVEDGEIKKTYVGLLEYTELKKFLVNQGVIVE